MVISKLQVTSYKLQVTSYKLSSFIRIRVGNVKIFVPYSLLPTPYSLKDEIKHR
ncbi:hypothetical protein [Moorena producens]|uniref:hypothetical protein n=1 Tax=Moorena producens TaxID=1155739 RepID=UPI001314BB63|nr:hypothetical protein [Moorena producens]